MKAIVKIFICIFLLLFTITLHSQLSQIKGLNPTGLSQNDAGDGIKEALSKGTRESIKIVSIKDGYFGNVEIKIPFPEHAKEMESKLRSIGLGSKVDEVVLSMNRAAEDAAKDAEQIFIDAIKKMTINDALKIVHGENDAATKYLKKTTSTDLTIKFRPIIKASLDKVNATKLWSELITEYNKIPLVKKQNPNLTEYVTKKAIEGLFIMIAKKELEIRQNPTEQGSELLKKVFGK